MRLYGRGVEASGTAGDDELHVRRHGVVGDGGVEVGEVELCADRFDGTTCLHVVDAANHKRDGRAALERARGERLAELGCVVVGGDVAQMQMALASNLVEKQKEAEEFFKA